MGVGGSTFTVLDPTQPKRVVDPAIGGIAGHIRADAAGRTPVRTGRLLAGWTEGRRGLASYTVSNSVRYAKYVEHGTAKHGAAQPMLGPAVFAARARYG